MTVDQQTQGLAEPASTSDLTAESLRAGTVQESRYQSAWKWLAPLLLLGVLISGAYFRYTGLDWDGNHHLHPDERFLTIVASQLRGVSNPLDYLRTSASTLNPYNVGQGFYVYGNLPMTLTRLAAEWASRICPELPFAGCRLNLTAYDGVHLLGRFLSGTIDLVTILFTYLIGKRLHDWRVGLLAAFLQATAVVPIQQSHFFTMDTWAAAFTTVAVYAAVRAAGLGDGNRLGTGSATGTEDWGAHWWILFGLGLGMAVASRINVAPLAPVIGVAAVVRLARSGHSWRTVFNTPGGQADLQRAFIGVALAAVISLATFRLAQPYAFVDDAIARQMTLDATGAEPNPLMQAVRSIAGFNPQWRANMEEIQRLQAPEASFPPALQWTDRAAILFPLTNMVLYGMGLTAGIAACLGFLWALWRSARFEADWTTHAIPLFWSGGYFFLMGTRWVKATRYFMPIYPTLFILGGWALFMLWQRTGTLQSRWKSLKRVGVIGLILLVAAPSLLWANAFVQIYRQPVTRVAASNWIFENVATGATLIYENGSTSKELQLPLKGYEFQVGGLPLNLDFRMPEDGIITAVRFNYLSDPDHDPAAANDAETLLVTLDAQDSEAPTSVEMQLDDTRQAVLVDLADKLSSAGTEHRLTVESGSGGAILASTSLLMNEHWDDLLPVNTDGRSAYGSYYTEVTGGQRPVTHPDDPQKRMDLLAWLDEADYIMLSSQRAVWSLPRLPLTYPLMVRYYEALFSGELGFDLVAQFHADLKIGPLSISDTGGRAGWGQQPEPGWPPPGDLAAEEAFSVYDHPPVWIFAKTERYGHDRTAQLLGAVDLSQAMQMNPQEASLAPNGLLLSPEAQAVHSANGTFDRMFSLDSVLSTVPGIAAIIWWLTAVFLGWLAFPIAFITFRGLPDRGYVLARILSLLLISYLAWLLASLNIVPHTRGALAAITILVGLCSLAILVRMRDQIMPFVRRNLGYLGLVEAVGALLFLALIVVRLGNPDLWDVIWGGEKPMDLSYFTAVLKSTTFPPYDPWFAGGYMNYYYFGFVYVGVLTKLLGIVPTLAYNLILPMLFSFTGLGVFSLAYNLVVKADAAGTTSYESPNHAHSGPFWAAWHRRGVAAGLVAAALAVLLGNLREIGVIANAWYRAGDATLETALPVIGRLARTFDGGIRFLSGQPAPIHPGDWFFTASRAINATPGEAAPITEFPFFTFLYADLHAHMIALPLTILALGWAIALALQPPVRGDISGGRAAPDNSIQWWATGLQWLIGGIALGVLAATNIWDLPTYLVIGTLAVVFHVYQRVGGISWRMLGQAGVQAAFLIGLAIVTFLPFSQNFGAGYTSVSFWPGSYTHVSNYLTIYGLFLFIIVTYLARELRAWTQSWSQEQLRTMEPVAGTLIAVLVLYVVLLLVLFLRGYWIAPIVLTLIASAGLLGLRPAIVPARRIVLILIACALGLTLLVEIFVVEGTVGRMNTVFKIYMQVWVLMSVVGGTTVVWVWPAVGQHRQLRRFWRGALALLVGLAALYPIVATAAKWNVRMSKDAPITLDGMAFMKYVSYDDTDFAGNSQAVSLRYDYDALQWMQRHVEGSPVVAEAYSNNYYRSIGNRVSMYTGLPAIIGWGGHQIQQRLIVPGHPVDHRIRDVQTLYNTTNMQEAMAIIERYNVEYIYAGQLEWIYYQPQGMNKFEQMVDAGYLDEVYRNQGVSIYQVIN